jgi:hypothetical protein
MGSGPGAGAGRFWRAIGAGRSRPDTGFERLHPGERQRGWCCLRSCRCALCGMSWLIEKHCATGDYGGCLLSAEVLASGAWLGRKV